MTDEVKPPELLELSYTELRFWQEMVRDGFAHTSLTLQEAIRCADTAIKAMRERLVDTGPQGSLEKRL